MTDAEIKEYLREPCKAQMILNALVVHSIPSIRQEERLEREALNREAFGY